MRYSRKFGFLVDFELLKAVRSTNTKTEVVFSGYSRHLEKWISRHIFAMSAPNWTKFGRLMQQNMPITTKWSGSKPEVEFQYGGRLFLLYISRQLRYVDEIWFPERL